MTTIAEPQERTPRVLLAGVLSVLAATVAIAGVAGLVDDAAAVRSAALGGFLVVLFFAFGALNVGIAARIVPSTALLVAMMTYTVQIVLIAVVFIALRRSDTFESTLTEGWLAGGMIAATLMWMAAQIVVTLRTPIPPWEGPTQESDVLEEVDAA